MSHLMPHKIRMVLLLIALFIVLSFSKSRAQNLIPNPSFEDDVFCPTFLGESLFPAPWINPTYTTPDYHNECGTPYVTDVPTNLAGYQYAHSGEGYGALILGDLTSGWREYITSPLSESLVAGENYEISFWISRADNSCATSEIGAYFSTGVPSESSSGQIEVIPQFTSSVGIVADTQHWVLIYGCFKAVGGETHITLGNFSNPDNTPIVGEGDGFLRDIAYYYIDDVKVTRATLIDSIDMDLGDPVLSCGDYIVAPDIPNIPDLNIYWTDGSTDSTLTVTESGTYGIIMSGGCAVWYDSIQVYIHGQNSVEIGPSEIIICTGDTVTISLDTAFADYSWQDGSTEAQYVITEPGLYHVTMNDECQVTSDSVLVSIVSPLQPIHLGSDTSLCLYDSLLIELIVPPGTTIKWNNGSSSNLYEINTPGYYSVVLKNACGETKDDIYVYYEFPPIPINLGVDTVLCDDDKLLLEINSTPPSLIEWQDGSTSSSYEITSPGNYYVTTMNTCGLVSDTINIAYSISPFSFDLGNDTTLCPGEVLILTAPATTDHIQWQDGSNEVMFVADQAQEYSLQISNHCGTVSDEITLSYDTQEPIVTLDSLFTLCPGHNLVLDVDQPIDVDYIWSTGDLTSSVEIVTTGIYTVTLQTECVTVQHHVEVVEDEKCALKNSYFIPNTFSPNDDGINDVFILSLNSNTVILSIEGTIYDRWGNIVFSGVDNPFTWDGKYNKESLNPAVFVYVIKVRYQFNGQVSEEVLTGNVTLIN